MLSIFSSRYWLRRRESDSFIFLSLLFPDFRKLVVFYWCWFVTLILCYIIVILINQTDWYFNHIYISMLRMKHFRNLKVVILQYSIISLKIRFNKWFIMTNNISSYLILRGFCANYWCIFVDLKYLNEQCNLSDYFV